MEYDVECANSLAELIKLILMRIKDGWMPQGGVCVLSVQNGYTVFYQAIVKENKM